MPCKPNQYSGPPKRKTATPRPSHLPHVERWRQSERYDRLRRWWFAQVKNQFCADCGQDLMALPTRQRIIDHIIPHRGDTALYWNHETNWASRCGSCHSKKTARGQ